MIVVMQLTTNSSIAAQDKPKGSTKGVDTRAVSKPSTVPSERPRKSAATATITTMSPMRSERLDAPSKPSMVGVRSKLKQHRLVPARKKIVPKAVVQPRTNLIPYGVLENAQRYDPGFPAGSAGVPHPQTVDLTHDHFQELDRNQDGKIDPVERAFGRIDMDRDLQTRTRQ
jgi:hypothetical protein